MSTEAFLRECFLSGRICRFTAAADVHSNIIRASQMIHLSTGKLRAIVRCDSWRSLGCCLALQQMYRRYVTDVQYPGICGEAGMSTTE